MDFKSMKRIELQTLCKKHGLPANSTNSQMALSLSSLLQNNENIKLRGCLKGSEENGRENSGPKKVSFSLEDDEFEFEKSLGIPEKRRSTRRASIGAIKADDRKARVPDVPARITRSQAHEVLHLTASHEDEDVQCDKRKKRKESCAVESNLRTLRNRVVIVSGNECELLGNQKLRRSPRKDAGKQKEDLKVDAFQDMKLGEGEVFKKKISRKRSRVADVQEALLCNTDYGKTIPERAEVDAGADVKVNQCGGPPPRRSKRVPLNTENVVFDVEAAKKVKALAKILTRSNVKSSVVESEISTAAKEISGVASDAVGGNKQMRRASKRAIKSKAPAVSESASEFITESTTTEARGQPEELPEFRVPSRRMTRSSSKQVAREVVTLLPASEKLVNGKETARATRSRKKHGSRKSSENLCPSCETGSVSTAVQGRVAHYEEVPLHPMQNTCKIGVAECEATEGLMQIDDAAREQDSIASTCIYAESEALAVTKQKVVSRRSTRNSTKNEAVLTSAIQNAVPKEKAVARRSTRHSSKREALLASVSQNVPVGVGKKGSSAKRTREAVQDEDASYVERDTSGGFPVTRNQKNGVMVDGNDKNPGSHVSNTRGSKSCRRVNSIDEAPQGEISPDPPLSLLEDSRQDIFIGEGSASNVSSKSQSSQRLQSIGKMSLDEQKNSENIHKRSDDNLVDEHKCMEERCSTHEDQVMISGSSEIMDALETLEACPCSAVQDNCAQHVDVENISEARNSVLVDPKRSSLSMHVNGSFGPAEAVTEAVENPQMDTLLASEHTKKGFTARTECVENVEQVNTAKVSHEFIDSESTSVAVADQCSMVVDVIHNITNEDDPKHTDQSHSVGGVSLTCEEYQELTPTIGIEVSLGVDQEKFAMVAGVPHATEISSHLNDISNDTHVNNSGGSSDQQSAPVKDIGTAEATPRMTMLVFKSATETFGYVEEIKETDKNSTNSCSGKLALEESKETLVPDSENFSLLVALQEDSAENVGDQMKQPLLVDRLSAVQCAGVSQRETPKISFCCEISHDGSSSHNHTIGIRPEARMHENKDTSASEHVVSLIVDKEASEVLNDIDAKNHSEMEGDYNTSLEENFCEVSIDLLPPTAGDLIEKKHDEGIGMAAKDIEFPLLAEDVASEMKVMEKEAALEVLDGVDAKHHSELEGDSNTCLEESFCKVSIDPLPPTAGDLQEKRDENKDLASEMVISEKPGCLDLEEDGAASKSLLQMDHETATLLRHSTIIDSTSEIHKAILEVVGEDAIETYDGCHEHGEQDNERAKISSIDVVLQQFIFCDEASAETVSEDFQKADYEEHSTQPKIQGGDEMASHLNSYSTVDSVNIDGKVFSFSYSVHLLLPIVFTPLDYSLSILADPETHDSSYLQTDVEKQMQAPSTFAREHETVSWDGSQTCETLPRDLKNSTAAYFPVHMGEVSGEIEDSHHNDDEKVSQVRNIPVTDNLGFQLCSGGLPQQDIHEEPDEANLKDVLGSIDSDQSNKEPNLLIYNLAAGGVSEVDTLNANTTVASDKNQISASPCNFHGDRDCASSSLVGDLKSTEETEIHAFNGVLMDADEALKHDFAATSDDLNKEDRENSEGDVITVEDGNENSQVLEENTTHEDVSFLLQRVCDNSDELHDGGFAAYSSESRSGLIPLQNASLPSQTKNDGNMVRFCTAAEVASDKIDEIEDKHNREVQILVKGSEPTMSEVNAKDGTMEHEYGNASEIAEQFNREQDAMKNENMDMVFRYGTDDIEGTQVAKGESESTSLFNIHENFKDGENAKGCQDDNSMFADMMVEERNTDITKSEGTSAESQLCEASSSAGQLVSVSKKLLCDNWNMNSTVDVCQAFSGKHDDGEIYQIGNQTCVNRQEGDTLKHEVIFQTETSNLQGHDNSSERIDSVDFEETKDCGIRDYLHMKEFTNLEGHEQIEETFRETGCQEQECGEWSTLNDANQTDAGSALSSQATETKQTIDPEPQHPLAKETTISIANSPQTNGFNSLDCQDSGLVCDEKRQFQDTIFLEDDNEKGLGDEMGDGLCSVKLNYQNDVHKLNNETSIVVENASNETENNSNGIEMHRMEETKCILNQSSAAQGSVSAESVDQAEESMNQDSQLVSSYDCSPSEFRNLGNTDDSEIDLLDEINHKLINFNISSANKFKKFQIHRTPMQLVDASRPQTRISELKNKENTSLMKIQHSSTRTVEKSRRPLQSLQNNGKV